MKSKVIPGAGILLSDSSHPARKAKPWLACLLGCSDPRYRTNTLSGLADELGVDMEQVAPINGFGGPAVLVYDEAAVRTYVIQSIQYAVKQGVPDVFIVQHTNRCKGLEARGITFEDEQKEFDAMAELVRLAVRIVKEAGIEANVWGAVLQMSQDHTRFKFGWVDEAPPRVALEI